MAILSDDEFIAQSPEKLKELEAAAAAATANPPDPNAAAAAPVVEPPAKTAEELAAEAAAAQAAAPATPTAEEQAAAAAAAAAAPQLDAEGKPVVATPEVKLGPDGQPLPAEAAPVVTEPDYKGVYERLFGKPIRAAGQDLVLKDPDEAISLIQKGAGFHAKMNRVQGDVAIAETLRQAKIDQPTLNLLIDAHQGKPGALKKLLDSAKVDPLTLDTNAEASSYAPSDHRVSNEQVQFQAVVADLSETTHGAAILQDARGWDQASKAEVYKTPDVLGLLAQQKEMGRYDKIVAEVNRAKVLGHIPVNESFLSSYSRVGQQMMQAGAFGPVTPAAPSTPTPVAQKVVTPATPANARAAAAAAPTRASGPAAKATVDIKSMSDAEFEAHFKKTFKI